MDDISIKKINNGFIVVITDLPVVDKTYYRTKEEVVEVIKKVL